MQISSAALKSFAASSSEKDEKQFKILHLKDPDVLKYKPADAISDDDATIGI